MLSSDGAESTRSNSVHGGSMSRDIRELVLLDIRGSIKPRTPLHPPELADGPLHRDVMPAPAVPVVNQIRTYWWRSPPRTGRQRMVPANLTARETGASFSKDKCVRTSFC